MWGGKVYFLNYYCGILLGRLVCDVVKLDE